ncbi:TPR-like protein [Jaminaea rosea]|uniref:TPR-like protein n=1 Tax=Jaminaea rosea TaxID=1569628 RepID=A0A316UKE6_9BASI|nr:TPR-like protein [Jaminaea rosea]PWN24841.1 TPR-like protein [Jaminaea rosea]
MTVDKEVAASVAAAAADAAAAASAPPPPAPASSSNDADSTTKAAQPSRIDSQLATALRLKEEGNALYAKGDIPGAKRCWHHANLNSSGVTSMRQQLGLGEEGKDDEETKKRAGEITAAVMNNLSSCYLAEKNYDKVLYSTSKVIAIDPQNVKAQFRRASALFELRRVTEAAQAIDVAMEKSPTDPAIRALATKIVKWTEEKEREGMKGLKGLMRGKGWGGEEAKNEDEDEKGKGKKKDGENSNGNGDKGKGKEKA